MEFLSFSFAGFGALVFAGWWILPAKARPWLLAAANLLFAGMFGSRTLVCLLLLCLAGYLCGRLLEKRPSRFVLWAGILVCLVPLAACKYLPLAVPSLFAELAAPVGLSFYGFKTIACLADVYRGKRPAERSLLLYFAWLGFFAQLTSGPIQRSEELLPQLKAPARFDRTLAYTGCVRLCWGLFLKRCLADQFALYQGALAYKPEQYYGLAIVWSVFGYGLYLYFDFASYSQLSIGVANLLGLRVQENFLSPYFSRSVGEFWRRWHISLSSFLRDYIYIPLGGSRRGTKVLILATMATFLASGVWHGAAAGFLVWGALHGIWLLIGRATRPARQQAWARLKQGENSPLRCVVGCAVTFLLVNTGWLFFAVGSLKKVCRLVGSILQPVSVNLQFLKESLTQLGYTPAILIQLGVFTLLAAAVDWLARNDGFGAWQARQKPWLRVALCYLCVFAALFFGAAQSLPNVYFAF